MLDIVFPPAIPDRTADPYFTISLYFFSAFAQVWAAIAIFGALTIRDWIATTDKWVEETFLLIQRAVSDSHLQQELVEFDIRYPKDAWNEWTDKEILLDYFRSSPAFDGEWAKHTNEVIQNKSSVTESHRMNDLTSIRRSLLNKSISLRRAFHKHEGLVVSKRHTQAVLRYFLIFGLGLTFAGLVGVVANEYLGYRTYFYWASTALLTGSIFPLHSLFTFSTETTPRESSLIARINGFAIQRVNRLFGHTAQ